jgi:hypothetical protein
VGGPGDVGDPQRAADSRTHQRPTGVDVDAAVVEDKEKAQRRDASTQKKREALGRWNVPCSKRESVSKTASQVTKETFRKFCSLCAGV